ncbi:MAG: metallophosphoesterase [Clostridiales bacterium]|nr:metallophosphoesterase [Clostridiales bacterium]
MSTKALCRHAVTLLLAGIFFLLLGAEVWRSTQCIEITNYTVTSDAVQNDMTLVLLTDLHHHVFGRGQSRLLDAVRDCKPDAILIAGDMFTYWDQNIDGTLYLVRELAKIAPVYYGYGNHEERYIQNTMADLYAELTAAGAVVLELSYIDTEIAGNPVRIGGSCGYLMPQFGVQHRFMRDFEYTERTTLLLAHRPEAFLSWGGMQRYHADYIFSGHLHGGQARLFGRGLFTPESGLFPQITDGMHEGFETTLFLSRGLGGSNLVPRFFNRPELVCVQFAGTLP